MRRSEEEPLARPPSPPAAVVAATPVTGATAMVTVREEIPAADVEAVLRWAQPAVVVAVQQRAAAAGGAAARGATAALGMVQAGWAGARTCGALRQPIPC